VDFVLRLVENCHDQPPDKNANQHIHQSLFHGRLLPNRDRAGAEKEGENRLVQQGRHFFQAPNMVGDLRFHCRCATQALVDIYPIQTRKTSGRCGNNMASVIFHRVWRGSWITY
jgi:hypothetical protein